MNYIMFFPESTVCTLCKRIITEYVNENEPGKVLKNLLISFGIKNFNLPLFR